MNSSNSDASYLGRRERKQPRFETGSQQNVKYPHDPADALAEDGGPADIRNTREQNRYDVPGDPRPLICNYSEDLTGLRHLILEVAVVQFPNVVKRHRGRGYYGSATEAFRVLVLPHYVRLPNSPELISPGWRAFLAIDTPGQDYHRMIVKGRPFEEIAAALQALLVVLGGLLTSGTEGGILLQRTIEDFRAFPFDEAWGTADCEVVREAEEIARRRTQPAVNNNHGDRNRQDNRKQQSGSRDNGKNRRKENQQSGGRRRRKRYSSSKKYTIEQLPGGRKAREVG